jgi:hypothetical protein
MTRFLAFMFAVMLLTGVVALVCDLRSLAYLKRAHRNVWEELNSPAIWPFRSMDEYRTLKSFIKAGGPQRIGDAELCRLTKRAQIVSRLYSAIFAVVFISAVGFFTGLWS